MTNNEINHEINRARFQGKTNEELKPLYVKRNTFGVVGEPEIFRIYELPYFLEDLEKSTMTLVNISPEVFGDPLENPILDRKFSDGSDEFTLGFLESYFGLSWTEEPEDQQWRWVNFTHKSLGVRVKVNLANFLNRLFDTRDKFFMVHYYAGKVSYHGTSQIEYWRKNADYTEFLDSLGQLSALSLTALRSEFSEEKEIRILYSFMPDENNEFVTKNVVADNKLCTVPFDWSGIVEEVLYDPRMSNPEVTHLKTVLGTAKVNCPVIQSTVSL